MAQRPDILEYAVERRPPAILLAIGWTSIAVGILGMLVSARLALVRGDPSRFFGYPKYTAVGTVQVMPTITGSVSVPAPSSAAPPPTVDVLELLYVTSEWLSAFAAAYLIVCGVILLRDAPRGCEHHLKYVWAKGIVTVVATVLASMLVFNRTGGYDHTGSSTLFVRSLAVAVLYGLPYLILGLAYPAIVLAVIRSRWLRQYCRRSENSDITLDQ